LFDRVEDFISAIFTLLELVMADWWLYNFDISLVQFEMSQINV
jgi:hypothetical protein